MCVHPVPVCAITHITHKCDLPPPCLAELLAPLLEANAQGVSQHSDAIGDQAIERRNSEMSNVCLGYPA